MKNKRIAIISAIFGVLMFGAVSGFGQIMVGGYKSVSVDDEGVWAAAEFAVAKQSEVEEESISVESIRKAGVQVVQGKNYKLCIEAYYSSGEEGVDGVLVFVESVIYQNLKGEFSLTSWKEADCAPQ